MIAWRLALKRSLRSGFCLILALLLVASFAAAMTGKEATMRPTGFVDEDQSENSALVCAALEEKGYLRYADRDSLSAAVSDGTLDCGAVLLHGLGAGIEKNQLSNTVLVYYGPMSFLTELYEAQISAVLFRMTAPLRTVQSALLAGEKLERSEIAERLQVYEDEGRLFTFREEVADGEPMPENRYGPRLSSAVAAMLLFTALTVELRRIVQKSRRLAVCIGDRAAARTVLLPQLTITVLLSFLAAAIPLCWVDSSVLAGLAAFCLCLAALALLLSALPQSILCVLLPSVLIGTLALYPIYLDLCARNPALKPLRLLLPPCWLLLTRVHPLLWAAGGLAALTAAFTLFRRRLLL